MKRLFALACVAALAACGGEQFGDLKKELNDLTKDLRGRVDPLPQVRPYEPVPYKAENDVDPFRPGRIDVAGAAGGVPVAGVATAGGEAVMPATLPTPSGRGTCASRARALVG